MLQYLGTGLRHYRRNPVALYARPVWELQAILSGDAYPEMHDLPKESSSPCLWVFPPGHVHGWSAQSEQASQVTVMHYDDVPEQLREACDGRLLRVTLTESEIKIVRELGEHMRPHFEKPMWLSDLHAESALIELTFIALKNQQGRPLNKMQDLARQTVDRALAWYSEHLSHQPDVTDMAQYVSLSESHLRRIFHRVTGHSPLEAMKKIQIERARQLMRTSTLSLKEIAHICGFSGPTVFSRSFVQAEGRSPLAWRKAKGGH